MSLAAVILNAARDIDPETVEDWRELIVNAAGRLGLELDGEALWGIAAELEDQRKRIQKAETAIAELRLHDVRANGPVRYGDQFIKAGSKTTKTVDIDGLTDWIETMAQTVLHVAPAKLLSTVFRLNERNLRITNLRAVADRVHDTREESDNDEDRKIHRQLIEDTFIETKREDDTELQIMPIDKAPKYAQALDHGQRVGSFTNKEART